MRTFFQGIGAVLVGFIAVVALSLATDLLLEAIGIIPPADRPESYDNGHWTLVLAYRTAFNVIGGYLAARLAHKRPLMHAGILGAIGTAAGIAGVVISWNWVPEDARWYPVALVVTALPFCWLGGKLHRRKALY